MFKRSPYFNMNPFNLQYTCGLPIWLWDFLQANRTFYILEFLKKKRTSVASRKMNQGLILFDEEFKKKPLFVIKINSGKNRRGSISLDLRRFHSALYSIKEF